MSVGEMYIISYGRRGDQRYAQRAHRLHQVDDARAEVVAQEKSQLLDVAAHAGGQLSRVRRVVKLHLADRREKDPRPRSESPCRCRCGSSG